MKYENKNDVRTRLLETGLRIFATRGYDGATVRDISEQSGCNIAAINYYYGDKKGFYDAVLAYSRQLRHDAMERTWEVAQADPWKALRMRVEAMLDMTFDDGMFYVNWLSMRELMADSPYVPASADDSGADRRRKYEERMTNLLTSLLGEEAATLRNLRLLRYTFYSLCLFLPIQKTIEDKYMSGKGFFNVRESMDKTALADFIMGTVTRTVEEMRSQSSSKSEE